jgi:hypothetical protein
VEGDKRHQALLALSMVLSQDQFLKLSTRTPPLYQFLLGPVPTHRPSIPPCLTCLPAYLLRLVLVLVLHFVVLWLGPGSSPNL